MKTNWQLLNEGRVRRGSFASEDSDGFNGAFQFRINGLPIQCIVSDGELWQHVSVSIHGSTQPPSWSIMCQIKDMFWGDDEWVVQYHPPANCYINNHPGVLHLWRSPTQPFPLPDPLMVGIKGAQPTTYEEAEKLYHEAVRLRTNAGASQ